jgi:AcrR family transcriptional regulator
VVNAAAKRPRDGVATRARIEKEALRLFAEKGVDGTTIRDLANAVGVADAALYRYFASKEQIASEIFTRHYGDLAISIRETGLKKLAFRACLRELVCLFCELFDAQPDVFAFILLNQHAHLRYVRAGENVVDELTLIMERAYQNGEISIGEADLAAAMALGAVLQPAVFKIYGRLPGPMNKRVEAMSDAAAKAAGAL